MIYLNRKILDKFTFYLIKDKYKNKIQNLMLEKCTDYKGRYIYLIQIRIKKSKRCKGYGSLVMYDIIKFADEHNVRIKLYIKSPGWR